jgi:hypothetical protein
MIRIGNLFYGLLAVAAGVVALKFNYQLVGFTGHIDAVERYLGAGSTYAFVKFLSVLLIVGGFLYMTGLYNPVLKTLLSPLAHLLSPAAGQ